MNFNRGNFILMKISVIMPIYNEKLYELKQSISSILNQSYNDFELVIVDDNPKSLMIKKFLLNNYINNSKIKLIFNKKNIGSMKSANKAIKVASGKYIARMDADDIAKQDRLQKQLCFSLKYNLDFVSCNFYPMVNSLKVNKSPYYCHKTQVNQNNMKKLLLHIDIAAGPTLFFKKNAVISVGGYRNILVEDYDLAMRMIVSGYRVGFLSKSLLYKRTRKNSLSDTNALKIYIIIKLISKYANKFHFTQIVPKNNIYKNLKMIRNIDYYRYDKFLLNSTRYKNNGGLIYLIKKYFWACSTFLIFKRNLFMLKRDVFRFIYTKFLL